MTSFPSSEYVHGNPLGNPTVCGLAVRASHRRNPYEGGLSGRPVLPHDGKRRQRRACRDQEEQQGKETPNSGPVRRRSAGAGEARHDRPGLSRYPAGRLGRDDPGCGREIGTADLPYFFRRPYGPGWALVGDAGYHKDPSTAQGISDAFRDAELAADAIDAGLAGSQPMETALAAYESRRNDAAMPMYEFTHHLASYEPPPPEMQQLFHALVGNQEQTNRFLGLIAGTTPFAEFFAPENVGAILAGAAQPTVVGS